MHHPPSKRYTFSQYLTVWIHHDRWWVRLLELPTASPQNYSHLKRQMNWSPCRTKISKSHHLDYIHVWKTIALRSSGKKFSENTAGAVPAHKQRWLNMPARLGCISTIMVHLFQMCFRRADVMLSIIRLQQSRVISLVVISMKPFQLLLYVQTCRSYVTFQASHPPWCKPCHTCPPKRTFGHWWLSSAEVRPAVPVPPTLRQKNEAKLKGTPIMQSHMATENRALAIDGNGDFVRIHCICIWMCSGAFRFYCPL